MIDTAAESEISQENQDQSSNQTKFIPPTIVTEENTISNVPKQDQTPKHCNKKSEGEKKPSPSNRPPMYIPVTTPDRKGMRGAPGVGVTNSPQHGPPPAGQYYQQQYQHSKYAPNQHHHHQQRYQKPYQPQYQYQHGPKESPMGTPPRGVQGAAFTPPRNSDRKKPMRDSRGGSYQIPHYSGAPHHNPPANTVPPSPDTEYRYNYGPTGHGPQQSQQRYYGDVRSNSMERQYSTEDSHNFAPPPQQYNQRYFQPPQYNYEPPQYAPHLAGSASFQYSNSEDDRKAPPNYPNYPPPSNYSNNPPPPPQYHYPPNQPPHHQQHINPASSFSSQPYSQDYHQPPSNSFGYPQEPPNPPPAHMTSSRNNFPNNDHSSLTRAVSSSFEKTSSHKITTRENSPQQNATLISSHGSTPYEPQPASPPASDSSWNALRNVASVDEGVLQKEKKNQKLNACASNDSSLSNSPPPQTQQNDTSPPYNANNNNLASLDSLSSVASIQEPIDTTIGPTKDDKDKKRVREDREEDNTMRQDDNTRSSPNSPKHRPAKRRHHSPKKGENATPYKSPSMSLSSPQLDSPGGVLQIPNIDIRAPPHAKQPTPTYPSKDNLRTKPNNFYFDRTPSYSYSHDSLPSVPTRGGNFQPPPQTSRPGSSASQGGLGITGMSSWDIQPQDSFASAAFTVGSTGSGGLGAGPSLLNSFSFSNDHQNMSAPPPLPPPHQYQGPPLESRNQSFESYSMHQSRSMDDHNYDRSPNPHHHQMHYSAHPPQHHRPISPPPPWGNPAPPHYQMQQHHYPPQYHHHHHSGPPHPHGPPPHHMRYQDGPRSSPPPPTMSFSMDHDHHIPAVFQAPPPEFHSHHSKPPPTVYIVSNVGREPPLGSAAKGVYSWTKEDDDRLTEIMKKQRNPKDWEPIAKEHGRGKSAKECHERWIRYLKPGVRKGQWQDHEDAIVVEAVTTSSEQPFTRWSDLAQKLPGRVGKQIRDRWVNHLNPAINHMPFTREDDLLLFKGHQELGKRWVEISTKYFNSTRSENHIKNRWYSASFKKFIANEFGPDAYTGSGKDKKEKKKEEDDDSGDGENFEEGEVVTDTTVIKDEACV